MAEQHKKFIQAAIDLARNGMHKNEGGPFGAVIVKDGKIIGRGNNQVLANNDPTAHAEVMAIRDACKRLGSFQLDDCIIYTSCEPCPMCLGAIYWARPKQIIFACNREDAAAIDFDDEFIYEEINLPLSERKIPIQQVSREEGLKAFEEWMKKTDKTQY
jgi:tRNA(Arg) A34 adenosine deaminase TadA